MIEISEEEKNRVNNIISKVLGLDDLGGFEIRGSKKISGDLGADDLDSIEILMNIEKEFNIEINDDIWDLIVTVDDIYFLVRDYVYGKHLSVHKEFEKLTIIKNKLYEIESKIDAINNITQMSIGFEIDNQRASQVYELTNEIKRIIKTI